MYDCANQTILALTAWRENRGGGEKGMQSVINVILNRSLRYNTSIYVQCTKPDQFSSITAKHDPELALWPDEDNIDWQIAMNIAEMAVQHLITDITGGATLYYAPKGLKSGKMFRLPNGDQVPFPDDWKFTSVRFTVEIADQLFFREVLNVS